MIGGRSLRRRAPASRAPANGAKPTPQSSSTSSQNSSKAERARRKKLFFTLFVLYSAAFLTLATSHKAQTLLIYLHWLQPPLFPPQDLRRYRLASTTRNVAAGHLRGWHLLPPRPPFPVTSADFESRLAAPHQRVIIFFHGNGGSRAWPKRVRLVRLLSSHLDAHVVTFDYSGFGDSPGWPTADRFYSDARAMYAWVRARVHGTADVIFYGQSLGTFAAVELAAHVCKIGEIAPTAVILDAAPASLLEAAMTHPITLPFRFVLRRRRVMELVFRETHDSESKIGEVCVPVLLVHGVNDGFIGVAQAERLYHAGRRAGVDVVLEKFNGCGHVDVSGTAHYLRVLYGFLKTVSLVPFAERL